MTIVSVRTVLRRISKLYPPIRTSLDFLTPFQLLVATILSAQCTDIRVNKVTKNLFGKYKTPEDFAGAYLPDLKKVIRPTGFYNLKAARIRNSSRLIVENFGSQLPSTMTDLLKLDGVGRKTANVVLSAVFKKQEGIAVDTHVSRLSRRLNWTVSSNPEIIERDLMRIVPRRNWGRISMLLILHGRAVCQSRRPRCDKCVLNDVCPSAYKIN
ncbi:MAG: endonuclease III [Nitrososphaerales archaeon]|nr:endonuclease III [Nitrososphaerota archaeon]